MKILLLALLLVACPVLVQAESYAVQVSLDHGKTFQPVTLPASVVRRILDQLKPGMTADVQIVTTRRVGGFKGKTVERMVGISCHETLMTEQEK